MAQWDARLALTIDVISNIRDIHGVSKFYVSNLTCYTFSKGSNWVGLNLGQMALTGRSLYGPSKFRKSALRKWLWSIPEARPWSADHFAFCRLVRGPLRKSVTCGTSAAGERAQLTMTKFRLRLIQISDGLDHRHVIGVPTLTPKFVPCCLTLPSAKRPEGRAARGRPGNVWQVPCTPRAPSLL